MMEEFNTEYKTLNTKQLFVCGKYQRDLDVRRVKRIVKNFNPNLVNVIKVSYRSGKYWVFDGQHTMAALKERNGGKDLMVECKVFYGMTYEDEARLFALQDGENSTVGSAPKLRSLYEARDIDVLEFKETVEDCGLVCDFKKGVGTWRLVCYAEAFGVFRRYGADHLRAVLRYSVEAWQGAQEGLRAEIVGGISWFIHDYEDDLSEDRLVATLSGVMPEVLFREGDAKDYKGKIKWEFAIWARYNKGLRTNRLPWKHGGDL